MRILLVDKDRIVSMLLGLNLKTNLRVEVITHDSAEQALALLESEQISVAIIADLVNGGLTGIELADRIIETYPDLPVVFTSGEPSMRVEVEERGIPFFKKPFDENEMVAEIRRMTNA